MVLFERAENVTDALLERPAIPLAHLASEAIARPLRGRTAKNGLQGGTLSNKSARPAPCRQDVERLDETHPDHRSNGVAGATDPAHVFQSLDQPGDFGGVENLLMLDRPLDAAVLPSERPLSYTFRGPDLRTRQRRGVALCMICCRSPTDSVGRKSPHRAWKEGQLATLFPGNLQLFAVLGRISSYEPQQSWNKWSRRESNPRPDGFRPRARLSAPGVP